MERYRDEKIAENFVVYEGMPQKEVSRILDVSEQTVSRWAKENNWKKKREEFLLHKSDLVNVALESLSNLAKITKNRKGFIDGREAELMEKIWHIVEVIRDDNEMAVRYKVMNEYEEWMKENFPNEADALNKRVIEFFKSCEPWKSYIKTREQIVSQYRELNNQFKKFNK